jgi:DivIVA domain-containing protein
MFAIDASVLDRRTLDRLDRSWTARMAAQHPAVRLVAARGLRRPPEVGILDCVEEDLRDAAPDDESSEDQVSKTDLRPARGRTFLPDVTGVQFSASRRGYDRAEVDQFVEKVSRIVVELEAMRSPDAVIERALADVGEETSAILRRARKAAEEIIADAEAHASERSAEAEARGRELREEADHYSARVKAEAERVLSEARSEAEEIISDSNAEAARVRDEAEGESARLRDDARKEATRVRGDADRYRAQVSAHIEQLAQERHHLIEDLRTLADQFHRTADRALEQIPSQDTPYEANEGDDGAAETQARSA